MSKLVQKKTDNYIHDFKNAIKCMIEDESYSILDKDGNICTSDFMKFVFDYSTLEFIPEDFMKRKRNKKSVPAHERCRALRANSEQCTRRRKDAAEFCGTHNKGVPHGVISGDSDEDITITKKTIWSQEVNGILHYIDDENNVYLHEDIIKRVSSPRIIGTWEVSSDGIYSIIEKD